MGRINFDDIDKVSPQQQFNNTISFFSLKNNRDKAIVRFLHNNLRDIEVLAVHYVKDKNGKTRAVSCLRGIDDPVDACPLCAAGVKLDVRLYFHMLVYTQDPNTGEWVGTHQVFDRGRSFSTTLETIAAAYNPLHKVACVIERINGKELRDTTYNVMPLPLEDNEKYPYYQDDLDYETVLGTLVPEKTVEDITYFQTYGEWPSSDTSAQSKPAAPSFGATPPAAAPAYSVPQQATYAAPQQPAPRRAVEPAVESTVANNIGPRRRV